MDIRAIQQTWDELAGQRVMFIDTFYEHLFEKHPEYRALFPSLMMQQRERMVEMISSVARFADHIDLIRNYLLTVGAAHRRTGITRRHVENFKEAFVETLAAICEEIWEPRHEKAWRAVFDDVVIPIFEEGLETGYDESTNRKDGAG